MTIDPSSQRQTALDVEHEEHEEHEEPCWEVHPAAANTESAGSQDVVSGCGRRRVKQRKPLDRCSDGQQKPVLIPETRIHGLSVERYRDIYSLVLQPSVLAALSSSQQADYISQVLELKQRLWTKLSRPRLQETLREDGRVEVKEIFDLT